MHKLIFLLFFVGTVFGGNAQMLPTNYDTTRYEQSFSLASNIDYAASAINTDILKTFYRGGFIDDAMKDASFDKHKQVNRFGLIGLAELEYINYKKQIFKNKDWGFVVKAGYNSFSGLLYSKDLFGLALYGNERYVGDTVDVSGSNASSFIYQKVGFGLIDPVSKSSISFNLYNISDRTKAEFRTLEVIQPDSGDEITFVLDGDVQRKNTSKFNQGIGFGIDLDLKFDIDWLNDQKAYIQFLVKDLGFSYQYEKQLNYSFDTTIVYTGLTFSEIIGDNSLFSDSVDLLDTLGIIPTLGNNFSLLPGFIQVAKIVDEQQAAKLQSFFGVRLYTSVVYNPYVFIGLDYRPLDWLHLGINGSFGGFSGFKTGLYASAKKGKFSAGLGTDNLIGFVSKRGNGKSLYLRVACVL